MKQGTVDLLASERGTLVLVLVIASTVLVILGRISAEQWLTYTQWICVTLVAAKTVTGAVETMSSNSRSTRVPTARVVSQDDAPPHDSST